MKQEFQFMKRYALLYAVLFTVYIPSFAQTSLSPKLDVKWDTHINSTGDTMLVLKNDGWGAATSKNRLLPGTSGKLQYSLSPSMQSHAFGLNNITNDNTTTQQASVYMNNIDYGFVYNGGKLYTLTSGVLYKVANVLENAKLLTIFYDDNAGKIEFYINTTKVNSASYTSSNSLQVTAVLNPGASLNKLTSDFSYPLMAGFGKTHASIENPSGMIMIVPEGGLAPYRFVCTGTGSSGPILELEPGSYTVTVKDSLNDSLLITTDIGITHVWRTVRGMAITDSGYVDTDNDSGKVAAAVAQNIITQYTNGFCEVTVTDKTNNLAFGFLGFEENALLNDYQFPIVAEQNMDSLLTFADSLLIYKLINPSTPKISQAYSHLNLAYFKDGIVHVGFKDFSLADANSITYQPGDVFKIQRTENLIGLYKNNRLVASNNISGNDSQTLLSTIMVSNATARVRGDASLNFKDKFKTAIMPEYLCVEPNLNWVVNKTFDENGIVKSESKSYMDNLGRNIQNQIKQFSKNNALVSEPLFDSWGRAVGQSLAAPSFISELCYVERFIQRTPTTAYTPADFDNPLGTGASGDILDAFNALGDVNHPKTVYNGSQGSLGWYYSNNNMAEPLVAADELPYARVEYYDNGRVRRSAGVGTSLSMGSGHETHFIYTSTPPSTANPSSNELNYVFPYGTYELEKNFGVYPQSINHNLQLFKTISINPDGRDQISYSNTAGQTIATCITGDGNGCVSHLEKRILYPQNIQEKLQNMYVPASASGTLRFTEFDAAGSQHATPAVPILKDLVNDVVLTNATDYTYDSNTGYFTFLGAYAGKSMYLQFMYSGTVTTGYTLTATVETEYTQWTLYFYDRKGRLLANTSPNDLQCQTLPSVAQRTSVPGDPGNGCSTNRVASITLNSEVKNAENAYVYINITEKEETPYSYTNVSSPLFVLKGDTIKYTEDSLYFANDTLPNDSLFINGQDSLGMPSFMYPTDSALVMYDFLDSLESKVPANAMRGKEIRYTGEYGIYARYNNSVSPEPLATIPYDFTLSGDGTSDSNGSAIIHGYSNSPRIRVKIKLGELAEDPDGFDIKHINPRIELYGFGANDDGGDNGLSSCNEPHTWIPASNDPTLNGMGQATTPWVDIDAFVFSVPLTIPLANKYMYDEYDRLVGSINEDQGTVYYVYDQEEDKLLFTQNQKQRDDGDKFSCIVYDKLGRPVVSGEYDPANGGQTSGNTPFLFQDYYTWKAGTTVPTGRISTGTAAAANSDSYNDGHIFDRTFIEYDNADGSLPVNFGNNPLYYKQNYTAAKVSKTWNDHTTTWYNYDELGRMIWTVQHSAELGYKTLNYVYDFRGKLTASAYQFVQTDNIVHQYAYDADERLANVTYGVYTVANYANFMKPLASYSYYLHGPLKRTVLGDKLQGLDYVYTIDGKLKAVNNPINSATGSDPGLDGYSTGPNASVSPDAFAYALEYYPGDYERSGSPIRSHNNVNAYSDNLSYTGVIKAQNWRTVMPSAITNAYSDALMYEYQYDDLYRLKGATFGTVTETAPTLGNPMWTTTFAQKPEYKLENISYDQNGNLQTLKRFAAPINSSTAHLLDDLTYNYNSTKKNRLEQVQDAASNTAGYSNDLDLPHQSNSNNYVYNSIGELVENKQEGLGYEYNSAGLVTRVYNLANNNPLTENTYNDKGLRYSKTSYSSGLLSIEIEQVFYVYDAGGSQVAMYKKLEQLPGTVYNIQNHTLYGAGRTGLLDATTGKALFEINDHVGNVRAVVTASANTGAAQTVSYSDYYPHGGIMPGRNYQSSLNFPYGYQGQEKDGVTGMVDFELRRYDPRIGRWYNPDPYGQHHSPYLAMGNNPVSFTDPDGGWDGDSGYDNGVAATDARNKNDFLAESFASSGQVYNWMATSPADREVMRKLYGTNSSFTSYRATNADGQSQQFGDESSAMSYAYGGYWLPEATISEGAFDYDVHSEVQRRLDGTGGSYSRLTGFMDKVLGKSFWSGLDKALGEGLFGKEGYGAVKKNAGNDNAYMFSNDELNEAVNYELEALSYFIPVGEIFQLGRFAVNWSVSRVGSRIINLGVKEGGSLFWSGLGEIALGEKIAARFAGRNGLITLSMKLQSTSFGRVIRKSIDALPGKYQGGAWATLSKRFAKSVTGDVNFLTSPRGPSPNSTWMIHELPILMERGMNIIKNIK